MFAHRRARRRTRTSPPPSAACRPGSSRRARRLARRACSGIGRGGGLARASTGAACCMRSSQCILLLAHLAPGVPPVMHCCSIMVHVIYIKKGGVFFFNIFLVNNEQCDFLRQLEQSSHFQSTLLELPLRFPFSLLSVLEPQYSGRMPLKRAPAWRRRRPTRACGACWRRARPGAPRRRAGSPRSRWATAPTSGPTPTRTTSARCRACSACGRSAARRASAHLPPCLLLAVSGFCRAVDVTNRPRLLV